MAKTIIAGFLAGFLAVLIFHQGTYWLMQLAGLVPAGAWNMAPVPPFGVPRVVSAAFWGGVWGMLLAVLLAARPRGALLFGTVFGALALTFVALTLVPMLRGAPMAAADLNRWWRGALLNGAWGWGVALMLLRPLRLRA